MKQHVDGLIQRAGNVPGKWNAEEAIENIDIGGPTLVRAAAKNHADVVVVVAPADYPALIKELDDNDGFVSAETRWRLARKAFARVTAYDCAISNYLGAVGGGETAGLGETFSLSMPRAQMLRYGENPHQTGALYGDFPRIAEIDLAIDIVLPGG